MVSCNSQETKKTNLFNSYNNVIVRMAICDFYRGLYEWEYFLARPGYFQ